MDAYYEYRRSLRDTLSAGWTMSKITSEYLSNIRFVQNNGIAIGHNAIHRSNNGGESWLKSNYSNFFGGWGFDGNIAMDSVGNVVIANPGFPLALSHDYNNFIVLEDSFIIHDSWFIKNNVGYAITRHKIGKDILFLKTVDGGSSWNKLNILPRIGNYVDGPSRLAFINIDSGWVSTPSGIFKTTNGGLTWSHLYKPPGIIESISAIDANTCYILNYEFQRPGSVEINTIRKTTDGGTSWQEVFSEKYAPGVIPITGFQFVNANIGYFVRGRWVYKSIDGGVNWHKVVAIHSTVVPTLDMNLFTDIYFTDANNGWVSSSEGLVLRYKQ